MNGNETSAELQARIVAEIQGRKFTGTEMLGFRYRPDLALIAGAAIGYGLALEDCRKALGKDGGL